MPAPLHKDAVSYLKQQNIPVTTSSLNRTMNLLQQQPNLRPSYVGQEVVDVDVDTMMPVTRGGSLPPLQGDSNTNSSFGQAFASARKKLGAGKTFDWNGKKYTTDYKEEVGQTSPVKRTSGDDIAPGDPINREAEAEMQEDLLMEKSGAEQIDYENEGASSEGPTLNRGNVSGISESNDAMNNLLASMLATAGGGAAVAGGAYAANRMRNRPQKMVEGDLNTKSPGPEKMMGDEDLYGKRPQKMTDADVFANDQVDRMMTEEDLTGNQSMKDQDFLKNIEADEMALDDERAAAKAIRTKNKIMAKKLLPRLQNLNDVDPRLITMLKGLM